MILPDTEKSDLSNYHASPVELLFSSGECRLYIKRDDLAHPVLEGNKYRKLKYILTDHVSPDIAEIVSFGGPFSNHLLAVAQAGAIMGLPTKGYIPAAYADLYNPTLQLCIQNGMEVITGISESEQKPQVNQLVIPSGGKHPAAFKGVEELYQEIRIQIPQVTHIALPCGTGTTIAGLAGIATDVRIVGINVMKMDLGAHLRSNFNYPNFSMTEIIEQSVPVRFGALRRDLIPFIHAFYESRGIILDMVYNAKALEVLIRKWKAQHFPAGAQVVYIHTGGSQGNLGYNARYGLNLPVRPLEEYLAV